MTGAFGMTVLQTVRFENENRRRVLNIISISSNSCDVINSREHSKKGKRGDAQPVVLIKVLCHKIHIQK